MSSATSLGRSEAQADWLGPKVGVRQVLVLHSSNEPGELLQWQHRKHCHGYCCHCYSYYTQSITGFVTESFMTLVH